MISVVIPVYNEERAVGSTIRQLKEVMDSTGHEYEIIAVNDGSKDNSSRILSQIGYIQVINHPHNKGYGASLKSGIKASKYEWILIIDADGTYPVEAIPYMLKYINQYDMIVGARIGKNVKIPLLRRPAKKIISIIANYLTERKIPDINSGFRFFKKQIVRDFFHLFPSGFSFTITITLAALTNEFNVKYIPINYRKRKGKSTIHPIKDFINFNLLIFRIMAYFNPLKIFLPFGFTCLAAGVIIIIFFLIKTRFSEPISLLGMLLIILGILVMFLGIIADLIVKRGQKSEITSW